MAQEDTLVAHLRRAGRDLNTGADVRDHPAALAQIVATALAAVPGTHSCGLTLADDRYLPALDATVAPVVGKLDALQTELGEGPAMTVLTENPADGSVVVEDFAGQDRERWPEFAPHALEAGFRSMISVLLEVEGTPRAALNLYSTRPHGFDARARRAAGLLGISVGVLLLAVEQATALQRAVESRDLIGRAKGMLMERFGIDDAAAFAKLVEASQHTNVKLVDVARWLNDNVGGALAPTPPGSCRPRLHAVAPPR